MNTAETIRMAQLDTAEVGRKLDAAAGVVRDMLRAQEPAGRTTDTSLLEAVLGHLTRSRTELDRVVYELGSVLITS